MQSWPIRKWNNAVRKKFSFDIDPGVAVVATGRSDFANQINNSLGFPIIFRNVQYVRGRTITDEMCLVRVEQMFASPQQPMVPPRSDPIPARLGKMPHPQVN